MRTLLLAAIVAGTALWLPTEAASDARRIDPMLAPSNVVHTGAGTYDDYQLASDVVAAISADRSMSGATVTVVVNDGRITLSGSAKDLAQAARAEQIVADIAGARRVEGKLDIQGG